MIQPKILVAAFAFAGMLTAGGIAKADGQFYVEAGVAWDDPDSFAAPFSSENLGAVWTLDDMEGVKLQVGGDFGMFRTDLKLRAMHGDVSAITNVTSLNASDVRHASEAQIAVATWNAYIDIIDIEVAGDAFITPYVGLGGGHAMGFAASSGNVLGVLREDHRFAHGAAWSAMAGALFSANEHIGLSVEYERLDTNVGGVDSHSVALGLRVTF